MAHPFFNEDKDRTATPNEIAKYLILDAMAQLEDDYSERFGLENMSEEQLAEVERFIDKHIESLRKRFNNPFISMR